MSQNFDSHPSDIDPRDRNAPTAAEIMHKVLTPIASLRITVVLFVLSLILIFYGTLAQMEEDVWPVVDKYFRSYVVHVPLQLTAKFGIVFFDMKPDTQWKGSFPFPGGLTIGFLMMANLLAAHAIRFRMTWKRSGIFLIHAGIILLMVGEFITGQWAVESRMTMQLGEKTDSIDITRQYELVIAAPLDDKTEQAIRIPDSVLQEYKGKTLKHDSLPVDIEVLEYWKNTTAEPAFMEDEGKERKVTAFPGENGLVRLDGVYMKIVPIREEAGVESAKDNAPAYRLRLKKKNTEEVVSQQYVSLFHYRNFFNRFYYPLPRTFTVDDKTYRLLYRNQREEKPYSLKMLKFEHEIHPGTNKSKSYASTVELSDPRTGETRELRIHMNSPLRHDGLTFYQAGFVPDDSGTVLQVVKNPAWLLPYIACIVVSLGMLIHFGIHLNRFLQKKPTKRSAPSAMDFKPPSDFARVFPWAILAIAFAYVLYQARPNSAKPDQPNLPAVEAIPVQDDGRIKPLDSLARVSLMIISSRTEYDDTDGKKQPAIRWLLEVMSATDPDAGPGVNPVDNPAGGYKVFRIENDQVLSFLGLESRPGSYRYSLREVLQPERIGKIAAEFARVSEKDSKKQNIYEQKIAELSRKVRLYQDLMQRKLPRFIPPQREGEQWSTLPEIDEQVLGPARSRLDREARTEASGNRAKLLEKVQNQVARELQEEGFDIRTITPEQRTELQGILVRRLDAEVKGEAKRIFDQKCVDYVRDHRGEFSPVAQNLVEMLRAWRARDTAKFNELVQTYDNSAFRLVPEGDVRKAKHETMYNHFSAFYHCAALFMLAFILGCSSWLGWTQPLNRAALMVSLLALTVHSLAMLARIYLQGRPPVTNLYSSAIFIGWGAVAVCVVLEKFYQNGVGNVVGSFIGFTTMIIAHHLGMGKDTLEPLEAVLDTNFWLATHVTTVTLGYMATFIAGKIGIYYIFRSMFTTSMTPERSRATMSMLYGVLCFATLLSFVGTVLGGIWADQSWGRFWGWDPKENGAVLIVLWNALILHARWGGIAKQRGIAVLSVVGNIITFWSWFGTNQLQIGLHSYGFDSSLVRICRYYWLVMLGIIAIGLLPTRYWRSFAQRPQAATA